MHPILPWRVSLNRASGKHPEVVVESFQVSFAACVLKQHRFSDCRVLTSMKLLEMRSTNVKCGGVALVECDWSDSKFSKRDCWNGDRYCNLRLNWRSRDQPCVPEPPVCLGVLLRRAV